MVSYDSLALDSWDDRVVDDRAQRHDDDAHRDAAAHHATGSCDASAIGRRSEEEEGKASGLSATARGELATREAARRRRAAAPPRARPPVVTPSAHAVERGVRCR